MVRNSCFVFNNRAYNISRRIGSPVSPKQRHGFRSRCGTVLRCDMKKCTKCGTWKFFGEFGKSSCSSDGLKSNCKTCHNEINQRWRENNPETWRNGYTKSYHKNKEKHRATRKKWRQNNPDKKLERDRRFRANNKEHLKEYSLAHPEHRATANINRRAREKYNGGRVKAKEWKALKEKYNYACLCCGKHEPEIKLSMDHVKPLALGGTNTIENIQPLCMTCNFRKHKKYIDYRETYQAVRRGEG